MKMNSMVEQAKGYKAGIKRAWEIFNYVDRETDKKIPLMLWGLLEQELSNTDDWLEGRKA